MSERIDWRGYWPAATTPFTRGGAALDETAWREQLDLFRDAGVHGVLVNGSSGEWYAQTVEERRRVAEIAVEQVDGAYTVVVGCTGFTPAAVIDLARHAASAGADGVLFTPPPYVHPTEEEVFAFYAEVAASVDLPIMAYNWPRGTSLDLSTELLGRLAGLDGVAAIKDSTPDYGKHLVNLTTHADDSVWFANYISKVGLGVLAQVGGAGSIEGGALGAGSGVPFYEAVWAGDLEAAKAHAVTYDAFLSDMIGWNFQGRFGSQVAQLKAAMRILGQPGGYVRSPLQEITAESETALRSTLVKHGLL
jgi:1-pyrroline-4-hydroxy-2-carboxylate deaminase